MVKVGLKTLDTQRQMDEDALLDCRATGLFMDTKWAKGHFISMTELEYLILVYNVDGSCNSVGSITHEATLIMIHKGHREKVMFESATLESVRATLNCYLWTCTKAVPKIQVKASWAHTKMKTRVNEWMSSNSL